MAVMMVRQGNDDDRLGALERAFVALRSELLAEMDRRFDRVEARLDKMDERFERVDEKFERLYRLMLVVCASMLGTVIAACGGLIATQL